MMSEDRIKRCYKQRCHDLTRYYKENRIREAKREAHAVLDFSYVLEIEPSEELKEIILKLM